MNIKKSRAANKSQQQELTTIGRKQVVYTRQLWAEALFALF